MANEIQMTSVLLNRLTGTKPSGTGKAAPTAASDDKTTANVQNASQTKSNFDPADIVVTSLNNKSQDLQSLLDTLDRSISTLQTARTASENIIATLEEAGGVTVRARDTLKTSAGYEGNKERLTSLEEKFTQTIGKISTIIDQAANKGVNLLKGDTLTTSFDKDGKSSIVSQGFDLAKDGIDFRPADFSTPEKIQDSRIDVVNAIDITTTLRNQLSSDIMLLQTRQEFSQNAIASLSDGANNIQSATLNDESANLLALQLRQQISDTGEPLASEAQRNILRQF